MFLKIFYLATGAWNLGCAIASNSIYERLAHSSAVVCLVGILLADLDYNRLVDWFQVGLVRATGRRFWYRVRFEAKDGEGRLRWVVTNSIGVGRVKSIDNDRELKKIQFKNGIKRTYPSLPIAKDFQITVEPVMYLGWY